jgi:predicted alpha/beta-fold hydrolase
MEKYPEAIAFAEEGQREDARYLLRAEQEEERPRKLLVVGRESHFSGEVTEYALEMAQRLSYEILALNSAPLSCETFKLAPFAHDKLCREFRSLSEKNVKAFQEKAEKMGIPFRHMVKFTPTDQALEEVTREFSDIEFVVSDTEEERAVERIEEGERPRRELYVYSML